MSSSVRWSDTFPTSETPWGRIVVQSPRQVRGSEFSNAPQQTLAQGSDLSQAWRDILKCGVKVNKEGYWYNPVVQNSNAFAGQCVLSGSLVPKLGLAAEPDGPVLVPSFASGLHYPINSNLAGAGFGHTGVTKLASGDGSPQTLQTGSYSIGDPRVAGIDYLEPSATTGQIGNGKGIGSGWNDPQNLQTTFPRNDFSTGQYTIGTPQGNYTPTNNFSWSNVPIGGFGNRGPSPTGDTGGAPSPVMRAPQKDRRSAAPDGTAWTSAQGAAPDTPAFQRDAAYSPTGDFFGNFPRMSAVAAAPSLMASNGSGSGSGPRITDALRAVPVLTRVGKFIGDSLITPAEGTSPSGPLLRDPTAPNLPGDETQGIDSSKTERPPVIRVRSNRYCGRCNTPGRAAAPSRGSGFVR
jgi:hypothetical protein